MKSHIQEQKKDTVHNAHFGYLDLHNFRLNLVAFTDLTPILTNLKSEGLHKTHAVTTLNLGTNALYAVKLNMILEGQLQLMKYW